MDYTPLGNTGIKVSVAGVGCGGPSLVGLKQDKSGRVSLDVVRQAIDLGVNFFDTAESYGTEHILGQAIAAVPRDRLVISTKKTFPPSDNGNPEKEIRQSLEQSLTQLRTDYIDIYHVHAVRPKDYGYAKEQLLPVFKKLRAEGKIRGLGISEHFVEDPTHTMLQRALQDNCWDVIMIGFNLLIPCARRIIFPLAKKQGVGVIVMYAVRSGLSQPSRLKAICQNLVEKGFVAAESLNSEAPLDFIIRDGGALTIPEAAYRFCRHEPGVDVVLTGTGNPEHLKSNIASILKPPLPNPILARLERTFGNLDNIRAAAAQ
jgi:aryl-alcohol dehydrogenase-like predicted oxidoreductase